MASPMVMGSHDGRLRSSGSPHPLFNLVHPKFLVILVVKNRPYVYCVFAISSQNLRASKRLKSEILSPISLTTIDIRLRPVWLWWVSTQLGSE